MNIYTNKLISYLLLQPRTNENNVLIGYLNSIDKVDSFTDITVKLIIFDINILRIFELDIDTNRLKNYSLMLNKCYEFINEECSLSFIDKAPFNNNRTANITDYQMYALARRKYLNEYESYKRLNFH